MTVSTLRTQLTETELIYFAAFYELKGEREDEELRKARNKR